MKMFSRLADSIRLYQRKRPKTLASKLQIKRDRRGLPLADPGPDTVIREGVAWLCRAQDNSASRDGGVARDHSLEKGWATSYPETTGYIVPTMLEYTRRYSDADARNRAARMPDWFVDIQLPGGGFQGGRIG